MNNLCRVARSFIKASGHAPSSLSTLPRGPGVDHPLARAKVVAMRQGITALLLLAMCTACSQPARSQLSGLPVSTQTLPDFPDPDAAHLVLGQTSMAAALASLGPPTGRATTPPAGDNFVGTPPAGSWILLLYDHLDQVHESVGKPSHNVVSLIFFNEALVNYEYVNRLTATEIDDTRLGQLTKGVSTKDDVLGLFGRPTGRSIPPYIAVPGREAFYYTSGRDLTGSIYRGKRLDILFDSAGRVMDFIYGCELVDMSSTPTVSGCK